MDIHFRGIAKAGEPNNLSPMSPGVALIDSSVHSTLRRKQRRLVREHPGLLSAIARGANQAIYECQYQFRNHRWNCSTRNFLRGKNLFGKIVDRGKNLMEIVVVQEFFMIHFIIDLKLQLKISTETVFSVQNSLFL